MAGMAPFQAAGTPKREFGPSRIVGSVSAALANASPGISGFVIHASRVPGCFTLAPPHEIESNREPLPLWLAALSS
jgi:hypothetical protein